MERPAQYYTIETLNLPFAHLPVGVHHRLIGIDVLLPPFVGQILNGTCHFDRDVVRFGLPGDVLPGVLILLRSATFVMGIQTGAGIVLGQLGQLVVPLLFWVKSDRTRKTNQDYAKSKTHSLVAYQHSHPFGRLEALHLATGQLASQTVMQIEHHVPKLIVYWNHLRVGRTRVSKVIRCIASDV